MKYLHIHLSVVAAVRVMLMVLIGSFAVVSSVQGEVSSDLASRHADAYTTKWQVTSPDFVVHLPGAARGPEASNQHFIVIPLKNGDFFAVWTSGFHESHPNQHINFSISKDLGRTWTEPRTIAGAKSRDMTEQEKKQKREFLWWIEDDFKEYLRENDQKIYDVGMASWGFPIYAADLDRVYVFYTKSTQPGLDVVGFLAGRYSDDHGDSWSEEFMVPFPRWKKAPSQDPEVAPHFIVWQVAHMPNGETLGCGTNWYKGRECWLWKFDNINTEQDPSKLKVSLLPEDLGSGGIMPFGEPTVVELSDGRWFSVARTWRGYIGYSISKDQGRTWSKSKPLRFRDGGEILKQPIASCPLYPLGNKRFLLTYHDNPGRSNMKKEDYPKYHWNVFRSPCYYTIGIEKLDAEQPIWFTKQKLFLDNNKIPAGPVGRTEIGTYTSFFTYKGKHYYWYPDRKHFLLGKVITDEMIDSAIQKDEELRHATSNK